MSKEKVLIEILEPTEDAFGRHSAASESLAESEQQIDSLLSRLAEYGIEVVEPYSPVPMFPRESIWSRTEGFANFASETESPDVPAESMVISAEMDNSRIEELRAEPGVRVWPDSQMSLFEANPAAPASGIDCPPFRPGVPMDAIRQLLGVQAVWSDGFRGQNVVIGVVDNGVDGGIYPVDDGRSLISGQPPGSGSVTSHGSMCAADVLIAAPQARLFDYVLSPNLTSGGALQLFQAILNHRRIRGVPHLTTCSFGYVSRPPRSANPTHETWNINHVIHRKIREVVVSGAPVFFSAGNCGTPCPRADCVSSSSGPGASIFGFSSLSEVITVGAVNSLRERMGYSAQGPGGFEPHKPDLMAYTHFFGNFGPGRPGGSAEPFDFGTSAAAPLAAGVGALLLGAFPGLAPVRLKVALMHAAVPLGAPGWDPETGTGVIHAGATYAFLRQALP